MDHIQNNAHFTMKELPPSEKPYEKCLEYGPGMLSDAELLAVVLRTGSRGQSAVEMCRSVLASFREESLCGLYGMTADELMQFRGIGKVKAVQLECIAELSRRIARSRAVKAGREIFRNPEQIADYYMEDFRHESQEKLLLIMLDTKGRYLPESALSQSGHHRTAAQPSQRQSRTQRSGSPADKARPRMRGDDRYSAGGSYNHRRQKVRQLCL